MWLQDAIEEARGLMKTIAPEELAQHQAMTPDTTQLFQNRSTICVFVPL